MRLRTLAGSVVAVTITFGVGLPAVPAAAADVTTLYVDKTVSCSDSAPGAGSTDLPYCTISAAAKVVLPGQTVFIRGGAYDEHVTINRSGTADHPIIFTGAYPGTHEVRAVIQALTANETVPAITVSGAHDVTIRDLALYGAAGDYLVDSSSRITIDHNEIQQDGYSSAVGVRLTGGTTATSVSRNSFSGYSQSVSVQLDAGTHDNTVTTNQFSIADQGAVLATDAPGTVVTSNTLVAGCGLDISLAGASSGSTVENNVAAAGFNPGTCSGGSTVGLTVSTGSATGTTADYNVFHPLAAGAPYRWAGTAYATQAAFVQATGQGKHDSTADPQLQYGGDPLAGSPVVDSADASAPGELDSDINYVPAVDDLQQPNTGTGNGYRDRGATERQGLRRAELSVDKTQGAYPLPVTVTAIVNNDWKPASTTYSVDFGDGTPVVNSDTPKVSHVYAARGSYLPLLTVTDSLGDRLSSSVDAPVVVGDPGPPHAGLVLHAAATYERPLTYYADTFKSGGSWPIASRTIDFGDGSVPVHCVDASNSYSCPHTYATPGTYQVSLTVQDTAGGTDATTQALTVGYQPGLFVRGYGRILDTRIGLGAPAQRLGPGGELTLNISGALPTGKFSPASASATSVVLNLTAVNATESSFLTAYASGQPRPTTSNSNFVRGQIAAHLVTVPVGADGTIKIYNHSGAVDVVADIIGSYAPDGYDRFTAVKPTRVLDTRTGQGAGKAGKIGPRGYLCFNLPAGLGLPPRVDAVVLNLTATGADQSTFLTANINNGLDTSSVNLVPGETVANQVIVPIEGGAVCINNANGHTDAVVDLTGYYDATAQGMFTPILPSRLLDTRNGPGTPLAPDSLTHLQIGGVSGIPEGATGAVLNLTATEPDQPGYLVAYPDGTGWPGTSSVNFTAGQTVPNLVSTGLGANGQIDLYNHTGHTHAVVDAFGYFSKP